NPGGLLTNPWATGTSGTATATPVLIGTHHWWIDCTGPDGSAHADVYHPVVPAPTVTLAQSAATTTFDGAIAQPLTLSWNSTNASSCTLQKINPAGTLTNPWATGTSGSATATPGQIGVHHWWIDCAGWGAGSAHADMYHSVVAAPPPPMTSSPAHGV